MSKYGGSKNPDDSEVEFHRAEANRYRKLLKDPNAPAHKLEAWNNAVKIHHEEVARLLNEHEHPYWKKK